MPLLDTLYAKQRAGQVELVPFFYSTSFTTLGASPSTIPQVIPITADSHFVARYANLTAYTGAANAQVVAVATPPLTIQFLDTSSGRTLFDNAQPIQNVMGGAAGAAGTGILPFIFPEPLLLKAGGSVQITLSNIGNSTFTRVDVSLCGFKVFQFGTSSPANLVG